MKSLILIGGLGVAALYVLMQPAHASGGKKATAKDPAMVDRMVRFLTSADPEDWNTDEFDAPTRKFLEGSKQTWSKGLYDETQLRTMGTANGELFTTPAVVGVGLYQLEGRPDVLDLWAQAFRKIGLDSGADVLTNKAFAIRQG